MMSCYHLRQEVCGFCGKDLALLVDTCVCLILCFFISLLYLGFLYLACTTILPDVLETDVSAVMRLLQVGSLLLGIGFMYLVAELEAMEETKSSDADGVQGHNEL